MRGDKLIRLIHVLNDEEKEQLIQFSKVDFHNNKKYVSKCIQLLCTLADFEKIDDQTFFKEIYSSTEAFNDEKLRDLIYFATLVFNDFIVYNETKSSKDLKEEIMHDFLQKRGLYKLLDQSLKQRVKQINGKKLLTVIDHSKLFSLHKKRFLIRDEDNFKKSIEQIVLAIEHLDLFYFAEKLKWSNELLGSELVAAHKYELRFHDEVLREANKPFFKNNEYISVYYLIALYFKKNVSKGNYILLKKSILSILPELTPSEKRSLIIDLHNYAIKLYSLTGNFEDIHEIHEVNELGIKHDAFIIKGKFGNHSALNIANVALRLELTTWVLGFVKKIKEHVADQNIIKIIEAMTAFQLEKYDAVRDLLNKVEYEDVYFAMTAKSFLAKTYFIQKEYALLDNHLKAMEQFYRRSKLLSEQLIESNLNFVLTLRKIMKHVNTPSKLTNICLELEGMNNMAYKAWVHSILKQLLT